MILCTFSHIIAATKVDFLLIFNRRMAEVNGSSAPAKEEEEPMDVTAAHSENYQTLIDAGLPLKVAESLDNIFQTGGCNDNNNNHHSIAIQKPWCH